MSVLKKHATTLMCTYCASLRVRASVSLMHLQMSVNVSNGASKNDC